MSIQLVICTARSRFGKDGGIRVNGENERLTNQKVFLELIGRECRSADLDLERDDVVDIIDFFVSDAALMQELTPKHFPELVHVVQTDLYIPCRDSNERFFLDYHFHSEGEATVWKICDMNALKEWSVKVKEFNQAQDHYDREKLALIVEDYERAIDLAEKERCVINFSY